MGQVNQCGARDERIDLAKEQAKSIKPEDRRQTSRINSKLIPILGLLATIGLPLLQDSGPKVLKGVYKDAEKN